MVYDLKKKKEVSLQNWLPHLTIRKELLTLRGSVARKTTKTHEEIAALTDILKMSVDRILQNNFNFLYLCSNGS